MTVLIKKIMDFTGKVHHKFSFVNHVKNENSVN